MISLEGRGHDEHVLPAEKGDHGVSFGPGQGGHRCDHEGGLYIVTHHLTSILSQKCERADVTPGLVLSLQFTAFDISDQSATCNYRYLKIIDGDRTTLMEKTCGSYLPGAITTNSNSVRFYFTSGQWSLNWTAVTAGGCRACRPCFSCVCKAVLIGCS